MDSLTWIRSSHSGGSGGNCVEVAVLPCGGRAVRDSKDPEGPMLRFTAAAWREFTYRLRSGDQCAVSH
jgi:Domain of unknown function (DUF397)